MIGCEKPSITEDNYLRIKREKADLDALDVGRQKAKTNQRFKRMWGFSEFIFCQFSALSGYMWVKAIRRGMHLMAVSWRLSTKWLVYSLQVRMGCKIYIATLEGKCGIMKVTQVVLDVK